MHGSPKRAACTIIVIAFGSLLHAEPPKPAGPDAKPKFTNALAKETSPYLLMHAHNPVNWYPWGPEAFAKAKKENKLVFLSVGYSSCYWCHVMERQSFANEEIAKLMNERLVCVKLDREERPDIDAIYMAALHARGRRGGWPLSMFLTPEGKPIWGGTYWPPDDKEIEGEKVAGFKTIVTKLHEVWTSNEKDLRDDADKLADAVNRTLAQEQLKLTLVELNRDLVNEVVDAVKEEYDSVHGGFGSKEGGFKGPKFPTPTILQLLLNEYERTKNEATLKIVTHTLDRMLMGGIYDQIGGGFHRYSVDREWNVPHFEKMLYDNAQLVSVYSRAYRLTKKPAYRRVVEETLAFIEREMTSPEGAFYCALDAETEAEEGRFYVWTAKEIDAVLPPNGAELVKQVYGVAAGPNFEEKFNVLLLPKPLDLVAAEMKLAEDELVARLRPFKQKLFEARAKRPRPFLDTKILTGWNGLMIAAYADAGSALKDRTYYTKAERAAEFLLTHLRTKDGRLLRTWSARPGEKGEAKLTATLEDYAFLVHGLFILGNETGKKRWLDEAAALTETMVKHHHDAAHGGFFTTAHDAEKLFARAKDSYDGATPSGNSVAAFNLVLLVRTGDDRLKKYEKLAEETLRASTARLKMAPAGSTTLARALGYWLDFQKDKREPAGPSADPKKDEDPVQLAATLDPKLPGPDGKQTLTITLDIAKGWHAYAHQPGNESLTPTSVAVTSKAKLEDVKVTYPPGTEYRDPTVETPIRTYEGKTAIRVSLSRPIVNGKPDAGPIEVAVRYQVCDDKRCLLPKTVKLKVGE